MTTGISEFWRKNTSASEATELANVLRALRKVAGHLGQNIGVIEYAGMSQSGGPGIVLDPETVMGEYPVPFSKMDYLVGMVTHEALCRIEWSEHVWTLLAPVFKPMNALPLIAFQKIVHFGESIYVDQAAEQKIFGLYVRQTRQKAIRESVRLMTQKSPSVDELIYLWWAGQINGISDDRLRPEYRRPLGVLEELSLNLRNVCLMKKGATARCEKRAELYFETFQVIRDLLASLPVTDKRLYWYPSSDAPAAEKAGVKKDPKKSPPLSPDILHTIELQLAGNSIDMTPIIRSVVGFDNEAVIPTSRWDFSISAHPLIDRRIVSRLKVIFQNYAGQNKVVSRGLASGKIDPRRLYRAPMTGRCFQQEEHHPNLDWNVALLMDASGSMRGNKWRMVENTVANIHKALTGFQNHLQAFAYFEKDGILMISHLIKNNHIQSVPPSGLTASGQAIIAAAYLMPKIRKRNILIHVTDGESNLGCDVRHAIDYCRKEKIDLITLGCGYKDREAMVRQYGKSIQFLDHFGQLTQAMERLLKWTFIYGKRPHLHEAVFCRLISQKKEPEKGSN
jgi:hypothetical protein